MKTFDKQAAQGDILIRRINELPEGVKAQTATDGQHVVAHSETGHHHTMMAKSVEFYRSANDDMIMYLVVNEPTDLIHNRSFDTHESLRFDKGIYEVRRQREYTPEGWRRVAD